MGILKKLRGAPDRKKAEALVEKGWGEKNAGHLQIALKHYRAAAKKDPTYALAKYNEGLALLDLMQDDEKNAEATSLEQARHCFALACALDEEHWPSFRMRMHSAAKLGRFIEAQQAAHQIQEHAPDDYGHKDEAKAFFKRVAEDADLERLLAGAEDDLETLREGPVDDDQRQGITQRLEGLVALNEGAKTNAQSLILAGRLCTHLSGDLAANAEGYFHRALELDPAAKVHRDLSNLFAASGNAERALPHALEAYRDEPTDAARVCNVGVCYLELGDIPNATEYLHIAEGLDPQGALIQKALQRLEAVKQG